RLRRIQQRATCKHSTEHERTEHQLHLNSPRRKPGRSGRGGGALLFAFTVVDKCREARILEHRPGDAPLPSRVAPQMFAMRGTTDAKSSVEIPARRLASALIP